ncbi:hypothetical protein FPOAC2_03753 [Fusarium poae]|uniref:hypothetical protein n=1 Tax=Fusarium poae TaxID=36050 RepID=UPI001CE77CC8|nr:hypothetical protein FPOAC1_003646 [Fusarium poae]KAG8677622.1 hypothetical protein FPOAC1_003646 [Fusarium poae]
MSMLGTRHFPGIRITSYSPGPPFVASCEFTSSPLFTSTTPPVDTAPQPTPQRVNRRQSAMTPLKRATANAMEAANKTPAPAIEPDHSTQINSTVLTNDNATIIFPWSDVEDSPARSRPRTQPHRATEPNYATPKSGAPAADNVDEALTVSWSDVDDDPPAPPAHPLGRFVKPNHETPEFASPALGSADETLAVAWSDVEDTPSQPMAQTDPATPKFQSPALTNDDTTIIFPWSDVEDSPSRKTRAEIVPAQDEQSSAAPQATWPA